MLKMFDAFDDDFAVDQSFLCDSLLQKSNLAVSKQSSCELTTEKPTNKRLVALADRRTQFSATASETSTKSRLKKFCFVKKAPANLNDDIESSCLEIKKINEAKISVSQNFNNADLSVLKDLDFDSFDNDDFDLDDSNSGDTISISSPSCANHIPKATDLISDGISVPLPEKSNSRITFPSSGTCRPKNPKCDTLNVPVIPYDSKLTTNNKNNTERTKNTVDYNEVNIITNKIVQCKRKFPGPAGLLPKFSRLPEPNQLFRAEFSLFKYGSHQKDTEAITESQLPAKMEMPCSQLSEDPFQKAPWLAMMKDLSKDETGEHLEILHKFNISMVSKKANNQKAHSNLKFPVLCVVIHSMIKTDQPDVSAVFKDNTGSISGMICQKLIQEFTEHLVPGSVLVLKQIMVMKLSSKRHCLNITPLSVVAIYSENDSGIVERLALNPVSWSALLQEANKLPPIPSLSMPSSSSKSVFSYKPAPTSLPVVFQSHSDRVLKSGQSNAQTSKTPLVTHTHIPHRPSTANSSPIATAGSNIYSDSVMQRNLPVHILDDSGDNSVGSAANRPLQKPISKLNAGCDLADDPLWTDDDFESMLLDSDMASAI